MVNVSNEIEIVFLPKADVDTQFQLMSTLLQEKIDQGALDTSTLSALVARKPRNDGASKTMLRRGE
ncbi:hypothetical protein ACO0QE_004427 [Hanseniaspora vineae]